MTNWDELFVHAQFATQQCLAGVGAEHYLLPQPRPSTQSTFECLTSKGEDATFKAQKKPASAFAQHMQTTTTCAKICTLDAQQARSTTVQRMFHLSLTLEQKCS